MHYVLFYECVADYLQRREPLRAAHMALAKPLIERGELFLGGAFANPADGAMLVFSGESAAVAEAFAAADPYVTHGLVTRWWVREWTTVVGKDAAQPLTVSK